MCTGPIGKQIQLLLLDTVFHITISTSSRKRLQRSLASGKRYRERFTDRRLQVIGVLRALRGTGAIGLRILKLLLCWDEAIVQRLSLQTRL